MFYHRSKFAVALYLLAGRSLLAVMDPVELQMLTFTSDTSDQVDVSGTIIIVTSEHLRPARHPAGQKQMMALLQDHSAESPVSLRALAG